MRIAAVVNGDVISNADIDARTRLFVMSTGMPASPDVMQRLRPQIRRQLIDERLRMQEALRRKIVIPDQAIAAAIRDIEQRNNLPAGALRAKLNADGVTFRTLVDQIRAQLAWTEVLRQGLGERGGVTANDVKERQALLTQMVGQTQYRLGEIFIPIDDPANAADAEHFADTVIHQLRSGAPFPMVAAQFSQTQNALEGGDLGWVQPNQLDPGIANLAAEMPPGAISNPVRVPGGIAIVQMRGKREIGREVGTILTARQVFLPFSTPLTDPQNPTEQQRQTLTRAREASKTISGCDAMEQYAKANKLESRPVDPGEIRLDAVQPPQFKALLASIPIGKATEPLITHDGIMVMVVCSREEKNTATVSAQEVEHMLVGERVELLSRQAMRDLHRTATIDLRSSGA
jgi:peptidyl-prolyl cis-trans isomerase SurA